MRYIKACCTFNGEPLDHNLESNFLGKGWNIYDSSSKLNPTNAFGFNNCARICEEKGGDIRYLQYESYYDGKTTACFPEGITTFTYPPEKTFWVHKDKLGLMEFMFPNDSPHSDFYQAILNGESIDHFVSDDAVPDENNADWSMHLQRVIYRKDMDSAARVPYATPNRMVHQAAEAKQIYSNVSGMMPADATDIYEKCQKHIDAYRNHWTEYLSQSQMSDWHKYNIEGEQSITKSALRAILKVRNEHKDYWKEVVQTVDPELYERVVEYEKFSKAMQRVQDGCLDRFAQLWAS